MRLKTWPQPLAGFVFLLCLAPSSALNAQTGGDFIKFGVTPFFLSDGQKFNHTFVGLGAAYEHLFSGQFSAGAGLNSARLLSFDNEQEYIRDVHSLEGELRFYPNQKGRGFYAGVSVLL